LVYTETAAYTTPENTAQQSLPTESEIVSNEEIGVSGRYIPSISENAILGQIEQKSQEYGVDRTLAYDIMWCESRVTPHAVNHNTNGTTDYGYWQINDVHLDTMIGLGLERTDPSDNLEYGFILLSESGTQPWSASQHCWEKLQANRI